MLGTIGSLDIFYVSIADISHLSLSFDVFLYCYAEFTF